jgi:hypothetical protein
MPRSALGLGESAAKPGLPLAALTGASLPIARGRELENAARPAEEGARAHCVAMHPAS